MRQQQYLNSWERNGNAPSTQSTQKREINDDNESGKYKF